MLFGAARMISEFNFEEKYPLWWTRSHDNGQCHISWLFVKVFNIATHPELTK